MKTSPIVPLVASWLVLFALVACQSVLPTPNTEATVSAAIQATSTAQAAFAATVDAAVKATAAAQPSPIAGTPRPVTATVKPATPKPAGPTATPVNYYALTEEELAALIDQAVQEAVTASNTATTTTTTATADGTVTAQEAQTMQTTTTVSQQEVAEALALIQAYYDLYGQVATDTLALLQAIEQDLNAIAQSLNQMSQILAQGAVVAQQSLSQLQAAATKANTAAASALVKQKNWNNTVKTELDKRANAALQTKPTSVPTDWRGTIQSVTSYVDTVRSALGDNKITRNEISAVSVAGANATAGLKQFGGTQFDGLSNSINAMTKQIARGEIPKAKNSLADLERSAKSLPSVPSLPKPSRP